jgi:hypothetical protein
MAIYARIAAGVVAELFTLPPGAAISDCFHPGLQWVPCDGMSGVAVGWTYVSGTFAASVASVLTLAQQAVTMMGAGLTIALTGSLSLAATTFPTDANTQRKLAAVSTTLAVSGAFPGGGTTCPMKDAAGAWHTFTVAQYKAVAVAISGFVAALDMVIDGAPASTTLPPSSISLVV